MAPSTNAPATSPTFDPSSLSIPVAAKLLGLKEVTLRDHVEQGLPLNPDGTLNLVHYAAWLNGTDDVNDGD